MKRVLLVAVIILSGCVDTSKSTDDATTWDNAARRYTCTQEQMGKVIYETDYALKIDTERNYPRYWYGSAIIRNCTLIEVIK